MGRKQEEAKVNGSADALARNRISGDQKKKTSYPASYKLMIPKKKEEHSESCMDL